MPPSAAFRVTIVFSPEPRTVREWILQVEPGTVVAQALARVDGLPVDLSSVSYRIGIWNKAVELTQPLCAHDRIEVYRALKVDPKVARRERFVQQGRRSAGLFAKKKPS